MDNRNLSNVSPSSQVEQNQQRRTYQEKEFYMPQHLSTPKEEFADDFHSRGLISMIPNDYFSKELMMQNQTLMSPMMSIGGPLPRNTSGVNRMPPFSTQQMYPPYYMTPQMGGYTNYMPHLSMPPITPPIPQIPPMTSYASRSISPYDTSVGGTYGTPLPSNEVKLNRNIIFYRNLFHTIHCKFAHDGFNWEGCRIYVDDSVGYSGNAKRFKRKADTEEKALMLECSLSDPNGNVIDETCLACKDYFEVQKYFKTNQECIGKMILVKNNSPISVENGQFKVLVKVMCCCAHHSVESFDLELRLTSTVTQRKVYSAKVSIYVKQWRKSNQKKDECTLLLE